MLSFPIIQAVFPDSLRNISDILAIRNTLEILVTHHNMSNENGGLS